MSPYFQNWDGVYMFHVQVFESLVRLNAMIVNDTDGVRPEISLGYR